MRIAAHIAIKQRIGFQVYMKIRYYNDKKKIYHLETKKVTCLYWSSVNMEIASTL